VNLKNETAMKHIYSGLVWLFLLFSSWGCTDQSFDCDNRLIASFESPDKSMKAVVFERTCGATTDFNRQVTLMKTSDKFPAHEKLNSFFVMKGSPPIEIFWLNTNSLTIKYEFGFQVIRKEVPNSSITVRYEEVVTGSKQNQ
jgi:hypothetical protein